MQTAEWFKVVVCGIRLKSRQALMQSVPLAVLSLVLFSVLTTATGGTGDPASSIEVSTTSLGWALPLESHSFRQYLQSETNTKTMALGATDGSWRPGEDLQGIIEGDSAISLSDIGDFPGDIPAGPFPADTAQSETVRVAADLVALKPNISLGLDDAVTATARASHGQAALVGLEPGPHGAQQGSDSLQHALLELVDRYGVDRSSVEIEQFGAFDDLSDPIRVALTDFMDAFLDLDQEARAVYENSLAPHETHGTLPMESDMVSVSPDLEIGQRIDPPDSISGGKVVTAWLEEEGFDLSKVFPARQRLLEAAAGLATVLEIEEIGAADSCRPVQVPPVFSIDAEDCDNLYEQDFALVVDLGGSDVYVNNAGGTGSSTVGPEGSCAVLSSTSLAALVDLGSNDDVYGNPEAPRCGGANGGGARGVGFLLDTGGDDEYHAASFGTNGGAYNGGMGLLLDVHGDDLYNASAGPVCGNECHAGSTGVNGGGYLGALGLLIDGEGDDRYQAGVGVGCEADHCSIGSRGVNGGGDVGIGFLFDADGDDAYLAGTHADMDCALGSCAVGSIGVNGGANLGVGFLLDAAGNDVYVAGTDTTVNCTSPFCFVGARGVHGGGSRGAGALVDNEGDDVYISGSRSIVSCEGECHLGSLAVAGGAYLGSGLLFDGDGENVYESGNRASCMGGYCYLGSVGVNGGAYYGGTGALLALDGEDTYSVGVQAICNASFCSIGSRGVNGGGAIGRGFLLDTLGDDQYLAGDKSSCGMEICELGSVGVNGGGLMGGSGMLVDTRGQDLYSAGNSAEANCLSFRCFVGAGAVNGGGYDTGSGFLYNGRGDDLYEVAVAANVTCDTDRCLVASLGVNGGASAGQGLLIDVMGDDTYRAGSGATVNCGPTGCKLGGQGANGGADSGFGSLVDLAGSDHYQDGQITCWDCTEIPKGTLGAQWDS